LFELDSKFKQKYAGVITDLKSSESIKIIKFYGSNYLFYTVDKNNNEQIINFDKLDLSEINANLIKQLDNLKGKLNAHGDRLPEFKNNLPSANEIINTLYDYDFETHLDNFEQALGAFSSGLQGLGGQDQPVQTDINSTISIIESIKDQINELRSKQHDIDILNSFPTIILHSSSTDKIPDSVAIPEFVSNAEETSKGMLNLCTAAGLSIQKIQELSQLTDHSQKEAFEDHYNTSISGGINEFWSQQTYHVHFRIEQDRLSVSISDDTYSPRIPPSRRSDGFQWYLSFYSTLLNDISGSKKVIILLDNPAIELHVDGQRDIKQSLEKKVTHNSQILYVTHSPAMIDPNNLEQLRKIELLPGNKGSKVSEKLHKEGDHLDLLEPVRLAIGANLVSSLLFDKFNVVAEGSADKPIIEAAMSSFHKKGDQFLINAGVSESKDNFLPKFYKRSGLPFVVYLDFDSSGRSIKTSLESNGLDEDNLLILSEIIDEKGNDREIEDLISAKIYHKAVVIAYPEHESINSLEKSNNKITKQYEDYFRTEFDHGFSKKRVAISLKNIIINGETDDETNVALKKLVNAIDKKCKAQIK